MLIQLHHACAKVSLITVLIEMDCILYGVWEVKDSLQFGFTRRL